MVSQSTWFRPAPIASNASAIVDQPAPSGVKSCTDVLVTWADLLRAQIWHDNAVSTVVFNDTTLIYTELDTRANSLPHALIACGVRPERVMALSLPRSVEAIMAKVAVLNTDPANSLVEPDTNTGIAIIGLAGRFLGARNATEFWVNLEAGRQSIRDVSTEEYLAAGGDPAALHDPYLVWVESDFLGIDCFDAKFFASGEVGDTASGLLLIFHVNANWAFLGFAGGFNDGKI